MMNKSMIFILGLIVLTTPVYAKEVVDLQQYSSCNIFGDCKTEVDINELSLTKDAKDFLKDLATDTPYDLASTKNITNFSIYIKDREKMIITGHITENTYWTVDFADITLDPYWNISTYGWGSNETTDITNPYTSAGSGGATYMRGFEYNTYGQDFRVVKLCAEAGIGISNATVSNATHICYAVSVTDECAEMNCNVSADACDSGNCYMGMWSNDNFYFYINNTAVSKYPINAGYFNITEDAQGTNYTHPVQGYPTNFMQTGHITIQPYTELNVSYYYTIDLYLNGTSANKSVMEDTTVNLSAVLGGNLSDSWNISIMVDNEEYALDEDAVENLTSFSAGTYNITANASFNESITDFLVTYFLLVNATPIENATTYTICTDNETLFVNRSIKINGDINNTQEWIYCEYECDNITKSCNPSDYEASIYNFGILILAIVGFYLIYRFARSRI